LIENQLLILMISAFVLSLLFIKLIIKYAEKFYLVDIPNQRSIHQHITPRGAGIGIFLSVIVISLSFGFFTFQNSILTFIGILLVYAMGIWDDMHDIKPKAKFVVIIVAAALLYIDDMAIVTLGNYLGFDFHLGWFAFPFTLLAVVSFTNAFNLIDGLDGLSGGIGLIILCSLAYIGYIHQDNFILILSLTSIAALLAFLLFNWNPASIFMGDSGSLTMGFLISLLSIKALDYIHPISIFYLAALPILDTIIVFIRRIRSGLSPFSADKSHIHHILLSFFQNNVKITVTYLYLIQLLFTFAGLSGFSKSEDGTLGLIVFMTVIVIAYLTFTGMYRRQELLECKIKENES